MTKQIIRLHKTRVLITTGNITVGNNGHALVYQRTDVTGVYLFDWSDYFTRDTETVTVTIDSKNCTATKVDGTDNTTVTVTDPSESTNNYVEVKVAITGGETFVMRLYIRGEGTD
jgi:hypothetical protein